MTIPTKITDHAARALADMLSQFDDSDRLRELVSILVAEIQSQEDVVIDVLTQRLLDNAVGAQLDQLGKIVGAPRLDITSDAEYRKVIRVTAVANQSDAAAETIIWIAYQLIGETIRYIQNGRAHFDLEYVTDTPLGATWIERIMDLLERACTSGVSFTLIEGDDPDAFRFDIGPGFDQGKLGNLAGELP